MIEQSETLSITCSHNCIYMFFPPSLISTNPHCSSSRSKHNVNSGPTSPRLAHSTSHIMLNYLTQLCEFSSSLTLEETKPFGFNNCTSYILPANPKTTATQIIMFLNHEPSPNQCLQSTKLKKTRPLLLAPSTITLIVTGKLQQTEEWR